MSPAHWERLYLVQSAALCFLFAKTRNARMAPGLMERVRSRLQAWAVTAHILPNYFTSGTICHDREGKMWATHNHVTPPGNRSPQRQPQGTVDRGLSLGLQSASPWKEDPPTYQQLEGTPTGSSSGSICAQPSSGIGEF